MVPVLELLYCKLTTGNTILHAKSFHSLVLIRGIPFSQYQRFCKNNSRNKAFENEAKQLHIESFKKVTLGIKIPERSIKGPKE